LVVFVVVAVFAALYVSAASRAGGPRVSVLPDLVSGPQPVSLPAAVAGLQRSSSLTGKQAIAEIRGLHVTGFPVSWAEVGWYDDGRVTVWSSRGPDGGPSAERLARRMATRLNDGGSPFTPPVPVTWAKGVWTTEGFDQVHFFFAAGDAVWWVSADADVADAALTDVLRSAS
jgi:hypothetical protein